MTVSATTIWTGGDCAGPPGYGYGGWCWLAVQGETARGFAGGERHTTAGRMALRAIVEALKAVSGPAAAPVDLDPGDPVLARLGLEMAARRAAGWRTPDGEPMEDADLWEEIARAGPVRFRITPAALGRAGARQFVDGWTAFARDCCKAKGAFSSAIPKPNLQTLMSKR